MNLNYINSIRMIVFNSCYKITVAEIAKVTFKT